jgi:hypothetical protein
LIDYTYSGCLCSKSKIKQVDQNHIIDDMLHFGNTLETRRDKDEGAMRQHNEVEENGIGEVM